MKYIPFVVFMLVCFVLGVWLGGAFTAINTITACKPNTTITYDSAVLKKPTTIRCEIISASPRSEG
jgi:hypothetical protein